MLTQHELPLFWKIQSLQCGHSTPEVVNAVKDNNDLSVVINHLLALWLERERK